MKTKAMYMASGAGLMFAMTYPTLLFMLIVVGVGGYLLLGDKIKEKIDAYFND